MANKNKKADDANWMAVYRAYSGTPQDKAAAIGATLQSDIARDKADTGDIHRNVANNLFLQYNDPDAFLKQMLDEHPSMEKDMDNYLDENGIVLTSLRQLIPIIPEYLKRRGYKFAEGGQFEENNNFIDVEINGVSYHLLHLVSEEEKEIGLMNVEELDPHEGALFDYSDEPQAELSFWMKDTTIPLLICFINESGKVISVHKGKPLSEEMITESSEFVAYVIEVGIYEKINPGDQTSLGNQDINEEIEDEDEEDVHPELNVNRLYVYGSDGEVQAELQGGERIFSRKSSKVIIAKAKRAYVSKEDKDYKALGRYIFKEMDAQDNREPEYVNN